MAAVVGAATQRPIRTAMTLPIPSGGGFVGDDDGDEGPGILATVVVMAGIFLSPSSSSAKGSKGILVSPAAALTAATVETAEDIARDDGANGILETESIKLYFFCSFYYVLC